MARRTCTPATENEKRVSRPATITVSALASASSEIGRAKRRDQKTGPPGRRAPAVESTPAPLKPERAKRWAAYSPSFERSAETSISTSSGATPESFAVTSSSASSQLATRK